MASTYNSPEEGLIAGRILAARVHEDALRFDEREDNDVLRAAPMLAYLHPGRVATIKESNSFPSPLGFEL